MPKCDICKLPGATEVDHIKPRSNADDNLRMVHRDCNKKPSLWRRIMRRIGYYRWKLTMWLDSWQMCHKEAQGYNCKHRIMSNGKKECGND